VKLLQGKTAKRFFYSAILEQGCEMKKIFFLLLLICPFFVGCSETQKQAAFPIKIGLLADSQITSQNGFSDFHYRSKFADTLVNVSIRPPALECYLSKQMLETALNKLTQDPRGDRKGVDCILYLGDAANSGGTDEIDTVIGILAKYRYKTGTPIFIIIGNHDYLGAGNIITPGIRFALLNRTGRPDNPAITKYEVLKRFSEFNHQNNLLNNNFHYEDNIESLEKNKNLDHRTGLYLAGIVTHKEDGKPDTDILLIDSSDYKDSPIWATAANIGFYGVIGSVSFKDEPSYQSQIGYLKNFARTPFTKYRIMASHYPKDYFDRITFSKPGQVPLNLTNIMWSATETAFSVPTFSKTLNQNLEQLLAKNGKNYWVSAHSHVPKIPAPQRFILGGLTGDKYFTGLNIGSTTDYRASAAIIERYRPGANSRFDNLVGYREITIFEPNIILFKSMVEAICDYGRQHSSDPNFQPFIPTLNEWLKVNNKLSIDVMNIGSSMLKGSNEKKTMAQTQCYNFDAGATILGLNRKYIEENWKDEQTDAAMAHLKGFMEQFINSTGTNREEVLSFLGLIAGAYEKGVLFEKLDLSPLRFEQLSMVPNY